MTSSEDLDYHHDDRKRSSSSSPTSYYDDDDDNNRKRPKLLHHRHHNEKCRDDDNGFIAGKIHATTTTTRSSPNPFNYNILQEPKGLHVSGCESWWDEAHLMKFVQYGMEENQLLRYKGHPITKCCFVSRSTAYIEVRNIHKENTNIGSSN